MRLLHNAADVGARRYGTDKTHWRTGNAGNVTARRATASARAGASRLVDEYAREKNEVHLQSAVGYPIQIDNRAETIHA